MTTRAVRNANPGNLVSGPSWEGLCPRDQMTEAQLSEPRFAVFTSPKWGFRALGLLLLNYTRMYHLDTVRGLISRWAPPVENDTDAYVAAVAGDIGVGPDDHLDLLDPTVLASLARAIAIHESGGWFFSDDDLSAGVTLAEEA